MTQQELDVQEAQYGFEIKAWDDDLKIWVVVKTCYDFAEAMQFLESFDPKPGG